jgi:hypothetical protein
MKDAKAKIKEANALQEKNARLVEKRANAETHCKKAHAHLKMKAKQARNTAHPDDVRFINLSRESKEKLRTQHNHGDKGEGCPKCRWRRSCVGGCLECVLAKGVMHELKKLTGCWSFDPDRMKSAVVQCLEDVREFSTNMTHLHDVAKPPLC